MFQNIKDRLHLIYIALTGKYFICVSYNKLDKTNCKVKGAHAVVNLHDSEKDKDLFLSTTNDFIEILKN